MAAVLAVAALAGCLQPAGPSGAGPPAAKGLPPMGPVDLPPGPFLEDPADLAVLEGFLTGPALDVVEGCGASVDRSVTDILWHYASIDGPLMACAQQALAATAGRIAEEALREGEEAAVYRNLSLEATQALAAAAAAISSVGGAGNPVEAEFLGRLMGWHVLQAGDVASAGEWWAPYESGQDRDAFQFRSVVNGLVSARAMAQATTAIVEAFPWEGTPCDPGDVEAVVEEARSRMERVLRSMEQAEAQAGESYAWASDFRNRVLPQFDAFVQLGWWEGILSAARMAEAHEAYWDGLDNPELWPTYDEARGILAYQRHEGRTIWSERLWVNFVVEFERDAPPTRAMWSSTEMEDGAASFLATLAAPWPYEGLAC